MNTSSAWAAAVTFLALLLTADNKHLVAQDRPSPKSLRGLKAVFLQVFADRGLRPQMEALMLRELMRAGIRTTREGEWHANQEVALLHLDVIIRCERDTLSCGYSVILKVGQHVQITRGERTDITATTWANSYTGSVRKTKLATVSDLLAVDAGTLVLNFVDDYRSANSE